ncbi:MAG: tetratricopeptide repeat protein [Steroidobacteraceae bacterium]
MSDGDSRGIDAAFDCLHRGDWSAAERHCRSILNEHGEHFDALNLLAIIVARANRPSEAADLFSRAVAARPDEPTTYVNYGNVLMQLGRNGAALGIYDHALRVRPDLVEALHHRGLALQNLQRLDEAVASYDRALAIRPDHAQSHFACGNALSDLRRFEEALRHLDAAVTLRPDFAEAHNNRGSLLYDMGRSEEALESFSRAVIASPGYSDAHYNRGNVLHALRRPEDALESYDRTIALKPDFAPAHNNRGNVLQDLNRFEEALQSYDKALRLCGDLAEAHCNSGLALFALSRFTDALESYDRALAIRPQYPEVHYNRANALRELKRFDEALGALDGARAQAPDLPWLLGAWLHAKSQVCDWRDWDSTIEALVLNINGGFKATPPFPVLSLVDSPVAQRNAAQTWMRDKFPPNGALAVLRKRPRRERIRIGYFSADFRNHPMSHLTAGLFETHDRSRFELTAFSFGPPAQDPMRRRMQAAFDRFVDVHDRSDREATVIARQLEIDIAIDLGGFTQDARPSIFAMRAAPLQVSFLGYPATMAADYIDYLIADKTVVPPSSRPHYLEKIVYLPNSYWPNSYRISHSERLIPDTAPAREDLGLPRAGFVFCCFNNNYKISPASFGSWMRILRHVEGSILWLLEDQHTAGINLRREAMERGIDPSRLLFAPRVDMLKHLARHRAADLFIDTAPYNAHTTASDALWMGLPMVTRRGECFAARVAASLLEAIGVPELITETTEQFEALAIELATHPAKLAATREKLITNRWAMPLFDTNAYARHLESAYRQMHERYLAGSAPNDIFVEP